MGCEAVSGGYHRPSDASHQPGPCEVSLNLPPVPPPTGTAPPGGESVPRANPAVHRRSIYEPTGTAARSDYSGGRVTPPMFMS